MGRQASRGRRAERLRRSIADGDFASASRLLDKCAHRGPGRGGGPAGAKPAVHLAEACGGAEVVVETPGGPVRCWRVLRTLGEVCEQGVGIAREYSAVLRGARQRFDDDEALRSSAGLCRLADEGPETALFLAAAARSAGEGVFLLGAMRHTDGQFHLAQHLAFDVSQEPAVLEAFVARLDESSVVVSYGTRVPDWTVVRRRAAVRGVEIPRRRGPGHVGLRREARKRWRGDVPDFRLETLERWLLARRRTARMARVGVRRAYERFLSTGDAREMPDVLYHNAMDLLSTAQITVAILTGSGPLAD